MITLPTASFPSYGSPHASHWMMAANRYASLCAGAYVTFDLFSCSCFLMVARRAASSFAFCISSCFSYSIIFSIFASIDSTSDCASSIFSLDSCIFFCVSSIRLLTFSCSFCFSCCNTVSSSFCSSSSFFCFLICSVSS